MIFLLKKINIEECQKINSSFKKKLIYKVGLDCGFFEPFCEDVITSKDLHYKTVNWKYMLKILLRQKDLRILRNILPYFSLGKNILYTQDVFGRSRDYSLLKRKYYIDPLKIKLSY